MRARSSLAMVVVALAAAGPAHAAVTIGRDLTQAPTVTQSCAHPACMYSVTSVGDASPIDGVITSWSERSDAGLPAKMRPRVVRFGTGISYTAVSNGTRVTITLAGPQTFSSRLRIAKGDNFAVEVGDPAGSGAMTTPTMFGTSGGTGGTGIWDPSPADNVLTPSSSGTSLNVSVSARVEPDADGDGYGDETQDPCPADAFDHATPCGAVTIGTPMFPRGTSGGSAGCSGAKCLWFDPDVTSPGAGVITRFRTYGSSPGGTYRLRTLTLAPSRTTAITHALSTESGTFGSTADPFLDAYAVTVPTRLPIAAGDRVGIEDVTTPGHGVQFQSGATGHSLSDATAVPDADPSSVAVTSTANQLLFAQADIEPDTDNDGYGDSTQDVCPLDAATHDQPCTADLALSRSPAPAVLILVFPGNPAQAPAIQLVNSGPVVAVNPVVTLTPPTGAKLVNATSSTGACLVAVVVTCTVGTLSKAATATLGVSAITTAPGSFPIAVHASSDTPDSNTANNDLTITASVANPIIGPGQNPGQNPPDPPCHARKNGTISSEVIAGTQFGDRISSGAGRDIVRGKDGDDCIYGGLGDDVLYGDKGNDRIYGQSGKDRVFGGDGNDTLTGSTGNDYLAGGAGNDSINAGPGRDIVSAGSGNDAVSTRDGTRDVVDCGSGTDAATVDRRDRVTHCEHVRRR